MRLITEARAAMAAAAFFSRLKLPSRPVLDAADMARAATYWPAIGLLTGAAMAALWVLALPWLGPQVAAGLAIALGVLLTGALQEDGLADVCDGAATGATRAGMLAIMHESRVGSAAVLGLVALLGLRWQVLAALPPQRVMATLLATEAASRALAVALMAVLPYVRGEGSRARPVVGRQSLPRLAVAAATGLAPFLLGVPAIALLAGAVAWLGALLWFRARLGGYTGDCVGATQQACALAMLLALLAAA